MNSPRSAKPFRVWPRHVAAAAVSALVLIVAATSYSSTPELVIAAAPPTPPAMPADTTRVSLPIRRGSTIGGILSAQGLSATALIAAAKPHYDLTRIRPDRDLQLVYTDGIAEPTALRYVIDADQTLLIERCDDGWTSRLQEVVYTTQVETRRVRIERSLWADGLDAGLRPEDLAELAQIFEYELDFNSELQPGATLTLVGEVMTSEHKTRLGDVHAVRLVNGDDVYEAVRHEVNGEGRFYHPDGTGMKRPFLRSPLSFGARVTSSFNPKRFHPILKRRRPHNGTDFGAPKGTSVRTVADGVVTHAGRNGGHGNFVKIRHDGGYETSYSHLSRISVKKGARISQGKVIGAVGSTGMSTGPHLHWQMWKNGRFVDAMKTRLPNSKPLPRSQKAAFAASVQKWLPVLDEVAEEGA